MRDDKLVSYTISWKQPYTTDFIMINSAAMFEEAIEQHLDAGYFLEALEVINMIRSKK